MQSALTVRDLLLPGEPLDPSEVVAGEGGLSNAVSWVVSLRPYPPAFPQLRGGEIALVATEHLSRLDPPVTLVEAIRYLVQRDASAVAVRGDIGAEAILLAGESRMPLLRLLTEMPLQDIEQAVMRECALHQARREVLPQERTPWIVDLLAGRFDSIQEVQSLARKEGYTLASHYAAVYLVQPGSDNQVETLSALEDAFKRERKPGLPVPLVAPFGQGISVLLPQDWELKRLTDLLDGKVACGIGRETAVLDVAASLGEAQLAALGSRLLYGCAPTRYADLGADRLLLLLFRDQPIELRAFVDETLGPLLRHDAHSAIPLLPTVQAFIHHGGRLRETSAEIYVHRNTLAYRLDRAAEILGVDLKDVRARLGIELALHALILTGAS